jgi:uncharacterized protein (DUF697 family)
LLVVMKALDPQQQAVLDVVRKARRKHPAWPVIVAQTALHEGYRPGAPHILPYPYAAEPAELLADPHIPHDLARAIAFQRSLFEGMPGGGSVLFVPIDFTQESDSYRPANYGLPALMSALERAAPAGLASALSASAGPLGDKKLAEAHPHIVGYAAAAAAADAVPAAGAVAVPAVQAKMLHRLAQIYGIGWNRRTIGEFSACLGIGTLSRLLAGFGLREIAKFVPVYGQTAGAAAAAAASFATTFAIGKAACYYLGHRLSGEQDPKGVSETYAAALAEAFRLFREREKSEAPA